MKQENWIKKALILGSVFFLAAYLVKPVGVSTQFSVLSGMIQNVVQPNVIVEDDTRDSGYRSSNAYYDKSEGKLAKSIKHPLNYDFVFVLAIPLGGFLAYQVSRKRRENVKEEEQESCPVAGENKSFLRTVLPPFAGGFLLLYGARMADGCTSGHMMSGMMQGSVSGYVFAGSVFLVAIPVAVFMGYRKNGKRGNE